MRLRRPGHHSKTHNATLTYFHMHPHKKQYPSQLRTSSTFLKGVALVWRTGLGAPISCAPARPSHLSLLMPHMSARRGVCFWAERKSSCLQMDNNCAK